MPSGKNLPGSQTGGGQEGRRKKEEGIAGREEGKVDTGNKRIKE